MRLDQGEISCFVKIERFRFWPWLKLGVVSENPLSVWLKDLIFSTKDLLAHPSITPRNAKIFKMIQNQKTKYDVNRGSGLRLNPNN